MSYSLTIDNRTEHAETMIDAIDLFFEMAHEADGSPLGDEPLPGAVYPTVIKTNPDTGEWGVVIIDDLIFLCDEFWYGQEEELELYPRLEQAEVQIELIETPIPF
jgi:hypothetical protein